MTTTGRRLLIGLALLALAPAAAATADTVTLVGSPIPLRDCEIQAIQGGRVHFIDAAGRRQRRGLEEIDALGFEDLPTLDEAEAARRAGEHARAIRGYLVACARAEDETARLWTHVRLAQTHDLLGHFVQAAGHVGVVLLRTDDPTWRTLVPRCEPDEPSFAAAHEALTNLDLAARRVTRPELKRLLADLRARVAPIHERLAAGYDDPVPAPDSTISGFDRDRLRAGDLGDLPGPRPVAPPTSEEPVGPTAEEPPPPPRIEPPVRAEPARGDATPEGIDRLLDAGAWNEAVASCAQVERDPGPRDLARFLRQYGRALDGQGRHRDAAVIWTRCAVHFDDTPAGQASLLEVARLYRDVFAGPETARRLARRVFNAAGARGDEDLAARAQALLDTMPSPMNDRPREDRTP